MVAFLFARSGIQTNPRGCKQTSLIYTKQDEEDDVDMYLKSLKRAEASSPPRGGGGPPKLSPEEVKRRNEEAKARMVRAFDCCVGLTNTVDVILVDNQPFVNRTFISPNQQEAYSRGELPPALQAWKSGAAPAAPVAATDAEGGQQQQGGFDPNYWQKFYFEQEAKLAAEKVGGSSGFSDIPRVFAVLCV